MNTSAQGLRVLVTAGAAGIGRAIARTFAVNGARVHICDVAQAALDAFGSEQPEVSRSLADVSHTGDVDRLFADVRRELGGLDVLVNNAGIAGPTAKVEDIQPADWERCIAVDLNGMFYCTRLAMPMLKANGRERGGSVINLSSVAGRLGFGMRTPYAAAKWAVIGFTKSLAVELGPFGIRANVVAPGAVEGPRMVRVIEAEAAQRGIPADVVQREYVESQSIPRFVKPSEIADMCVFLASSHASMVNGQVIAVDGNTETFHIASR